MFFGSMMRKIVQVNRLIKTMVFSHKSPENKDTKNNPKYLIEKE